MIKPTSKILSESEIEQLSTEADELGIPQKILRFNQGSRTSFSDDSAVIFVRGDVFPDLDYGDSPRDIMSSKAVLAHEYYGHYLQHPSNFKAGDWRDEFRASYEAAIKAPNLTDDERRVLMLDAYDRAREFGVTITHNKIARRIIYGIN